MVSPFNVVAKCILAYLSAAAIVDNNTEVKSFHFCSLKLSIYCEAAIFARWSTDKGIAPQRGGLQKLDQMY